jgi:hypothetical protein
MENLSYSGGNISGIYIRNSNFISMENINFASAGTGKYSLNIDNTCSYVQIKNAWRTTYDTWSTGGLYNIFTIANHTGDGIYAYLLAIYDPLPATKPYFPSIPTYANNSSAVSAGLDNGSIYKTSTGVLMTVY